MKARILGLSTLYLLAISCGRYTIPDRSSGHPEENIPMEAPIENLNVYLDEFHFYNGDISKQIEAHHYCSQLSPDMMQCVLYDGDKAESHIIGVEYVVSEALFELLPADERKLWHSHNYEIKSGMLIAPETSSSRERQIMRKMANTYGKTWLFWHVSEGDTLPLGSPKLMMNFTKEDQIDPVLLKNRNDRYNINEDTIKHERSDIPVHQSVPGANSWETGEIKQLPSLSDY